jgi:hypothetical protein
MFKGNDHDSPEWAGVKSDEEFLEMIRKAHEGPYPGIKEYEMSLQEIEQQVANRFSFYFGNHIFYFANANIDVRYDGKIFVSSIPDGLTIMEDLGENEEPGEYLNFTSEEWLAGINGAIAANKAALLKRWGHS